jgi:HK97 family phage major capsid protein
VSRARELAVTLGTDSSSTTLPSSPSGGLLAGVNAGYTQGSGSLSAGITLPQLNSLAASVDRAYYEDGAFMASPSVEAGLKALLDTTGRSLIPTDPATGLLNINGKLLYPNNAMSAALTAATPLVLFGDFSKAYSVLSTPTRVRVVGQDGNPSLAYNLRQLIIYTRLGASTGITNSVKSLVSAAS